MVEISGVTQWIFKMLINPIVWFLILVGIVVFIVGCLWIRKKRALRYGGAELVDLGGNGKFGVNFVKCGWYGIKIYARGLWWRGREVMRTKEMEMINEFSEEDFQEVDGKRGVVFFRDPINKELYPINRLQVQNKELIAKIPPAEFVDNALSIIDQAIKETSDWKERIMQFIAWAMVIIFSLVAIIIIVQMVKNGQDNAAKLIADAGKTCLENARTVCSEISGSIGTAGNAP